MMSIKQAQKVMVICGQTATGKSALAVSIAKKFGGEVISADSRQVYKGLDIGTGKITEKEMAGVLHHLLDVANPRKRFTVAEFQEMAREKIGEILSRGKVPILCGGTGLYLDAVIDGRMFPEVPPSVRLRKRLEKKTTAELFALLKRLNPLRAKTIDAQNPRRLVRAIEIALHRERMQTRREQNTEKEIRNNTPKYNTLWIGLTLPSEKLREKISIRLFARLRQGFGGQARISRGMIAEVRRLHKNGISWKRMDELGLEYRLIAKHLRGVTTRQEMTDKLKTEIWHYAKRQMTWFQRNKSIKWFNPREQNKILKTVRAFLSID